MANLKSAKKRIRRSAHQAQVNRARVSRVRTYLRKVELAIASGNAENAREAFKEMQPELMRGAQKGLYHRNKVSRTLSRLSARINALEA